MSSVDDWLNDEQFDFDVSASPIGEKAASNLINTSLGTHDEDDDDEEVFFGPQTHKERIAAVVVKEKEAIQTPIESLSAEEQALILKESALLSVRIKHGTPGSSRSSPIAVVHPMPRETQPKTSNTSNFLAKENKENINKENTSSLTQEKKNREIPTSKTRPSKILQPKFALNKGRPASQPEPLTTKLPVSKTRGKLQSDLSEPLVDKVSLYGLNKALPSATKKSSSTTTVRRRSGIPAPGQVSDAVKTNQPVPSLLPSAVPASTTRLRAPLSKSTSDVKSIPKGPMRVPSTQSSVPSAVPQPGLRLQNSSRKSIASTGTPRRSSGIAPPSSKRRSKTTTTPSTTSDKTTSRRSLVTPVQRTPSSRKQITARQLVAKEKETSRTPSPTNAAAGSNAEVELKETEECEMTREEIPSNEPPKEEETAPKVEASGPSHSDIMSRYKRLKARQSSVFNSEEQKHSPEMTDERAHQTEIHCKNEENSSVEANETEQREVSEHEPSPPSVQEETLVEINNAVDPLMEMSPMKTKDYFLDPFHTGATPPPLIDVMDVLVPERPAELNLIEF